MNIEKTICNLKSRGFGVMHFQTGAEAVTYLAQTIHDTTVGIGGSKTIDQMGLYDTLCRNNTVYWHWKTPGDEVRSSANIAAVYLSSANAISENGEIINIDGTGNRIAAQAYGRKKLYIIAGTNKICPDFESALYRARNIAAVQNAGRFSCDTPCKSDGKCHDCRVPGRICNALLVLWGPVNGMEAEVVLIDEELGL